MNRKEEEEMLDDDEPFPSSEMITNEDDHQQYEEEEGEYYDDYYASASFSHATSERKSESIYKPLSFVSKKKHDPIGSNMKSSSSSSSNTTNTFMDEKDEDEIIIEDEHLIDETMNMTPEKVVEAFHQPQKFTIIQPKKTQQQLVEKEIQSTKTHEKPTAKRDKDFGHFIEGKVGSNVLRMMYKMGWQDDKGLGPTNSGIINPIKVVQTSKNQAIIITDEHVQKTNVKEEEKPQETKQLEEEAIQKKGWKKKNVSKKKIKSVEQLLKEAPSLQDKTSHTQQPYEIIDMTGPTARVVSKLSEISSSRREKQSITIPELQFNVKEIVRQTEASIRDTHEKIKLEKEKFERLYKEKEKYEEELRREKKKIDVYNLVFPILAHCNQKVKESKLSIAGVHQVFSQLKQQHPDIFEEFHFSNYTLALIQPILTELFKDWNPLTIDHEPYIDLLLPWRNLFQKKVVKDQQIQVIEDEYEKLLQDILLPPIRKTISVEWNPKEECENAILFIDKFVEKICTHGMKEYMTEKLIIPKIKQWVQNEWNPKKDSIPIHIWIHPWFAHISIKTFETHGIINLIKNKLETILLRDWNDINDPRAYDTLEPWKDVFTDYYKFLVKTVTPQIVKSVQKITISTDQTQVDTKTRQVLSAVMHWYKLIPEFISAILESQFFPKWWKVLYHWLCDPSCSFTQVNDWYQNWKEEFEDVDGDKTIQLCLKRGLDMIYQALSNKEIQPAHKLPLPSQELETLETTTQRAPKAQKQPPRHEKTFKELIEDFAEENNLPFIIKHGQYYDGKQLYNFNGITTYIENDCLHVKSPGTSTWKPVTLSEFMELSSNKKER
ncbi:hypothetical protein FDP41_005234 [Naegleria fowleri]|uniref:G-patch domain-containing protein n=1 Tax=Naegleria fowleri TaxID=5763 RepID=A0A6A5BFZ8_NAEFO|nr:uncharacterized protein FDP41_005234 [Naegleria fowleri]KAF0975907.1 hypothetical protein FDP41_005234 [Naegleria fowleri]CAG4710201.1 unnamed protein product [Naegleria fowleri]